MDDTDKVQVFYDDARDERPRDRCRPTSTRADYRFAPLDAKRIRYGLGAVKGTGEQAIENIVAARERSGRLHGTSPISAAASTGAS